MFGVLTAVGAPSLTLLSVGVVLRLSQKKGPPPPELQQQVAAAVAQARAAQPPRSRPKLPDIDPKLLPQREKFSYDDIGEAVEAFGKGQILVLMSEDETEKDEKGKGVQGEVGVGAVEGCLVCSADGLLPEQMAWIIKWTSGFVTIALPGETLEDLEIPMMSDAVMETPKVHKGKGKEKEAEKDEGRPEYAVSVDFKLGTTTGISARDRALTARALANPDTAPEHFTRPGHLVPVLARPIPSSQESDLKKRRQRRERESKRKKIAGPPPPPPHPAHALASAAVTLCDMTDHEAAAVMSTLVFGNEDDSKFERKEGDTNQEEEEDRAERFMRRDRNKRGSVMTRDGCREFADKWGLKMISVGMVKKEWWEKSKKRKEKSAGEGDDEDDEENED